MEVLVQEPGQSALTTAGAWHRQPNPWRRYAARMIDVQLFGGVALGFVGALVGLFGPEAWVEWFIDGARWKSLLIFTPLSWIATAVAVAALLAWKGTTPGKLLFGLRVIPADDAPLTFSRAIRREMLLLVWGIGFAIPILNLIAGVTSYYRVENGGTARWDEQTALIPEGRRIAGWQLVGVVVGTVLVVVSLLWGMLEKLARIGGV